MNKQVREVLLKEFEQGLRILLPQIVVDKSAALPSGWRLYKQRWNERATIYLVLCTSEVCDEFTVEIAWSEKHRFPSHLGAMYPVDVPRCDIKRDESKDGEFLFRVGRVMPMNADFHWKASRKPGISDPIDDLLSGNFDLGETPDEEYEDPKLLKQSVSESMNIIKDHALPFVELSVGPRYD